MPGFLSGLPSQLRATVAVPGTAWTRALSESVQNREALPSGVWKMKLRGGASANIIPTRTGLEHKYKCMLCYKLGFFIYQSEGWVSWESGQGYLETIGTP